MVATLDEVVRNLGPIGLPVLGQPTTVSLGRGQVASTRNATREQQLLALIGQTAIKAGLGAEGAKVAQAIAVTEGGLTGAVGDVEGGGSYGPFQFYAQGQLRNFAAAMKVSTERAKQIAVQNPEVAIEWALRGYLGQAIRAGMKQGLAGPSLATYAQANGQVSVSPQRAGANYASMFKSPQALPLGIGNAKPSALVPNQFGDPTLTREEALSACGPAAAVAFARRYGRNPTLREAMDLAETVGWTQGGGMNGLENQARLVAAMAKKEGISIPTLVEKGSVNWNKVANDAMNGNPVIVSTDVHYYVVDGYDPNTQRFHVGQSGVQRKDLSKAWVTANEIETVDGSPNGALYIDDPRVPGRGIASRQAPTGRDDWRTSSRPTLNLGVNYDDAPGTTLDDEDVYQSNPALEQFERHTQALQQQAAQTRANLAASSRSFFDSESQARPVAAQRGRDFGVLPVYESVFEGLLDPKRGVPFLDFKAPGVRV